MPRDGRPTRQKILDTAQALIFEHGFAGTTIDRVLEEAQLTKGAFFHHFRSKNDLSLALIKRYIENEVEFLEELVVRAESMSRDPLQQVLIIIGLLAEKIEAGEQLADGCLLASYALEIAEFEADVRAIAGQGIDKWRAIIGGKISEAIDQHPTRYSVDADELADAMLAIYEGGLVIARLENNPLIIATMMRHYRDYIELLFSKKAS